MCQVGPATRVGGAPGVQALGPRPLYVTRRPNSHHPTDVVLPVVPLVLALLAFAAVLTAAWRVNRGDVGLAEVWVAVLAGFAVFWFSGRVLGL